MWTEITRPKYERCAQRSETGRRLEAEVEGDPLAPMVYVTWDDAKAYVT